MRKYILTRAELIEDLKNGKRIYKDEDPQHYYEMIDGVICGQLGENTPFLINCTIDMDDILYTEEELFTIEVGKFYKTRNGKKAYCFYKDEEDKLYPNHFVIEGESGCETSRDDGLVFCDEEDDSDIVGYWED